MTTYQLKCDLHGYYNDPDPTERCPACVADYQKSRGIFRKCCLTAPSEPHQPQCISAQSPPITEQADRFPWHLGCPGGTLSAFNDGVCNGCGISEETVRKLAKFAIANESDDGRKIQGRCVICKTEHPPRTDAEWSTVMEWKCARCGAWMAGPAYQHGVTGTPKADMTDEYVASQVARVKHRRAFCRLIASEIIRAMGQTDTGPEEIDQGLGEAVGMTSAFLGELIAGRSIQIGRISDLAAAMGVDILFGLTRGTSSPQIHDVEAKP